MNISYRRHNSGVRRKGAKGPAGLKIKRVPQIESTDRRGYEVRAPRQHYSNACWYVTVGMMEILLDFIWVPVHTLKVNVMPVTAKLYITKTIQLDVLNI